MEKQRSRLTRANGKAAADMRALFSIVIAASLLAGCETIDKRDDVMMQSGNDYDMVKTDARTIAENERTHIRFEQSACFGTCPAYEMFVTPDDRYYVYPQAHVHRENPYAGELERGSFEKLRALLKSPQYTSLKTDYTCRPVSDMPGSQFEITEEGFNKTVDVYWGCNDPDMPRVKTLFKEAMRLLDLNRTVYKKVRGGEGVDYPKY